MPDTEAGKRLLAREAMNSRSFALITADAILDIEAEASLAAAFQAVRDVGASRKQIEAEARNTLDEERLARAIGPVIEKSLSWLQLWRFNKQDENPWPDLAAAIARAYREDEE